MVDGEGKSVWGLGAKIAIGFAALLILLLVVAIGGYYWLDTRSGHAFVARQVAALEFENGMKVKIGSIDGSIYGKARLKNLRIADLKGDFVRVPDAALDWNPLSYLGGHVDVKSLTAAELHWTRMPEFKVVPDTGQPLLPDLDIDIDRLKIDRIIVAEAVTGQRHIAALDGSVHIADRRAVVKANATSVKTADMAGGDRLIINLDAVPDKNLFDIDLALDAPANGLFAGLMGKEAPTTARLAGKGNWDKWDGTLKARSGSSELADVALMGRSGRFNMKGYARPSELLGKGVIANAFSPVTGIDMTATMTERRVDLQGAIASEAITLTTNGIVDLAQSEFNDLTLNLKIDRAASFFANMGGRDIAGKMLLNGSFAKPAMNYSLSAARLSFDDVALEGLTATGEARVDPDRIVIPVNARVRRISGLSEAAGGLLTNVTLNGNLAVANGRVLSDNMRLRSDRINATAVLIGDLNKGFYTGALKGRINDYRVDSVGMFNIDSDVDIKTEGRSGFALVGTIRARSTKLFSPGVRKFLGGNMFVNAGIRYGTDGIIRITSARVVAPQFRLNSGSGTYLSNGQVKFAGSGFSNQYGPVSAQVSGTLTSPVVRVVASRPGFGIGLSNVVAIVRQSRTGFDITANGDTSYGPFSADLDVLSGSGPMTVDVNRGNFAGIAVTGRLIQNSAGPFVGRLTGVGSGFDGTIDLSGVGENQRLVVDAVARDARLEGPPPISIGSAIINADVVLYDQPQIVADVQLAETSRGTLSIAVARAKIDYRGGSGTAQILAEGRNGVPFRVAGNAELTPSLWRIAAKGRANGIDFETAGPLRIIPRSNAYQIMPSTIKTGRGAIQIAGSYGDAIDIQTRLNNVRLALLNPMLPGLGVGGRASGSIDWYQASVNAFPRADARLTLDNFTRTSLSSVSQPVDISLVGRLLPDGGNMRAIIRRRGAAVGRLQVDLTPLAPGSAGWMERLLAAPLTGGIRYNGPADTLFSLAALPDQSVTGTVGVAADFSGRVQSPQLTGVVRANDLVYENETYGTRLTKLRVRGVFTNDRLEVTELSAKAGDGTITGKGFISLSSAQEFPIQLNLDMDNARLARSEMIATTATGQLEVISNSGTPPTVRGTLNLPETRYRLVRQGAAKVATLTGVRRKAAIGPRRVSGDADVITSLPSDWLLDINLVANDELYVSGMGLESEWSAKLHITGTPSAPIMAGQMNLIRGTLGFAGRSFELEEGRLSFDGGPAANPTVRVSAASDVDGVTVRVNVRGTGYNPEITFTSTPALPQDEVMARILFGNSIGELNAVQAVQLAASLNSLSGGGGGLNPLGVLQSSTGLDRLRILGADEKTGRGTAVAFGQYITNDVYVEIVTDARGYTATQIEISLTRALSILSQMSTFGTSNVNVRYKKDY